MSERLRALPGGRTSAADLAASAPPAMGTPGVGTPAAGRPGPAGAAAVGAGDPRAALPAATAGRGSAGAAAAAAGRAGRGAGRHRGGHRHRHRRGRAGRAGRRPPGGVLPGAARAAAVGVDAAAPAAADGHRGRGVVCGGLGLVPVRDGVAGPVVARGGRFRGGLPGGRRGRGARRLAVLGRTRRPVAGPSGEAAVSARDPSDGRRYGGGMLVTLDEIRAAAKNLAGVAVRTPLLPAPWAGPDFAVKAESLQVIGAFKIRGAYHALATLPAAERARGVAASSSGNHAQAVAYAARSFGVPAVIVIPEGATPGKVAATRALGAEVVRVPPADRDTAAAAIAADRGLALVPPYDDARVIAGQGTVGLEIVEDWPDVDVVLVPVSGGGLISGVAAAVKALRPSARVFGVEPALAADTAESLRRGEPVFWPAERTYRTIADALRASSPGRLPWEHILAYVDDVLPVTEDEIRSEERRVGKECRSRWSP